MADDPLRWELPSNGGYQRATARLVTTKLADGDAMYVADIVLEALRGWDEPPCEDHRVRLHRVEMRRAHVRAAHEALARWMDDREPIAVVLASGRPGAALSLSLGPDPALVSGRDKPVARFHFTTDSGLDGTCRWVTDETCIRVWMDGIGAWLAVAIGS